MIAVYSKVYRNKFTSEITYYFDLQVQGKPQLSSVYECISDYDHYYSKYVIFLNFFPHNKSKIELEVLQNAPILLNKTRTKRKLAVLTKFIFYLVMKHNEFSITNSIRKVEYHNNGQEFLLSSNAFLKSYYKLIPFFNDILSMPSSKL